MMMRTTVPIPIYMACSFLEVAFALSTQRQGGKHAAGDHGPSQDWAWPEGRPKMTVARAPSGPDLTCS